MLDSFHSRIAHLVNLQVLLSLVALLCASIMVHADEPDGWPADYGFNEFQGVEFIVLKEKEVRPGVHIDAITQAALRFVDADFVQRELSVTAAQKQSLAQLSQEYHAAEQVSSNRNGSRAELRRKDVAMANTVKRVDAAIESLLLPSQKQRLNEILFQASGADGFHSELMSSQVANALGLSDMQKKSIDGILKNKNQAVTDSFDRLRVGGAAPAAKQAARRREYQVQEQAMDMQANDQILALLSPAQLQQVAKLSGKEIDVRKLLDEMHAQFLRSDLDEPVAKQPVTVAPDGPKPMNAQFLRGDLDVPVAKQPAIAAAGGPKPVIVHKPSMRRFTGPKQLMMLFETDLVRQEMKFTAQQQGTLRQLKMQYDAEGQKMVDLGAEPAEISAFHAARRNFENRLDAAIEVLLSPDQKARLDEITFQAFFPYAFCRHNSLYVAEYLGLSDTQTEKIDQICQDYLSRPSPMWGSGSDERARWNVQWKEERATEQDAATDINSLLTGDQRHRLAALEGRKIALVTFQDQLWAVCLQRITTTHQHVQDLRPNIWPRFPRKGTQATPVLGPLTPVR